MPSAEQPVVGVTLDCPKVCTGLPAIDVTTRSKRDGRGERAPTGLRGYRLDMSRDFTGAYLGVRRSGAHGLLACGWPDGRATWVQVLAVWQGHRVLVGFSTLTPPSWTSKMKWGAGWSLQ